MRIATGRTTILVLLAVMLLISVGCVSNMYVQSAKISMNNLQDYQKAKGQLLEGTKNTPEEPEVWYLLGEVYFELSDYDSMLYAFKEAEKLAPAKYTTDIEKYYREAHRLTYNNSIKPLNEKDYASALPLLEQAERIIPGDYEILKLVAYCMQNLDRKDEAKALYIKLTGMEKAKTDVMTHYNLLVLYNMEQDWDNVVKVSDAILAMPDSLVSLDYRSDVFGKKAMALTESGDVDAAIAAWDEAIQTDPNYSTFYFNKAVLLYQNERIPEAIDAYAKVIELDPEDDQVRKILAVLMVSKERWQDTINVLEPWLYPDGEITETPAVEADNDTLQILYASYANVGKVKEAKIVKSIIDNRDK